MPAGEASVSSDGTRKPTHKKSRSSSPSSSSSSRSVSKSKAKKVKESNKKKKPESSNSDSSDSEATKKKTSLKKKKQVNKSKKQESSSSESESGSSSDSEPKKGSNSKRRKVSKSPKRRKSKSPAQTQKSRTKTKEETSRQRSASTSPAKSKSSPAKKVAKPPSPSPSPPPPPPAPEESGKSLKKEVPKESRRSQSPVNKKSKIDNENADNKNSTSERSQSPVQSSTREDAKKTKSRSRSHQREKAQRSKSRSHSRSNETRRKKSKSPIRKRRSRSSSSSSSESGHARRRNGGGGGIRIGRKTGVPSRQPKGVRASRSSSPVQSSASGSLKSIAEKETKKENSAGSKKVVVDKSDTSLFKEDGVSSGVKTNKKENGVTAKSRFGPPLSETKTDTSAAPIRERKSARPPPKPVARANPDSPLTLPQWCDLIDWHDKRDVHFEMMRRSEKLGSVSLQKRKCYVIGRTAPLCDIVIDHPSLSRRHAVILHHRENGCVYVMDLKSTQGTWVNRRKLIPHLPTALTEKCTLSFGTSSRTYHLRGLVPQDIELPSDTLTILTSRGTLENTVIEGVQMGEDGPLPFHAVTTDDKQLVHDEALPEEGVRSSRAKPVTTTAVSTQTGRFEDMEPETAFVPVAEPTGSAEEEKLKSLTPAARIVFLRKQEEAKAAAARQQALRAMSSGNVLRGPVVVPLDESTDATKKEVGLYDVIDQVGKRSTLDAKQKKILLGGTKIPSITSSFCSSSSSSKLDND